MIRPAELKRSDKLGYKRSWLCLFLCVVLAGCSTTAPDQPLVFETGDEYGAEVVLGDRSILPACSGEGFCSNAVAFIGALDQADQQILGTVFSPRGDQTVVLGPDLTGRVSPSGNWLLIAESNGVVRLGADGSRLELDRAFTRFEWAAGDRLLARSEGELHILDSDGVVIETIVGGPADVRFEDMSEDGERLLFRQTEFPMDAEGQTSLWIYERSESTWIQLELGDLFVLLLSPPGFGPNDDSVIVQVDDSEWTPEGFESFDYRIQAIDIESGEITLIEKSTGAGAQFLSVAPDGRTVAIRGANMLRVVDAASGRSSPFVQVGGHNRNAAPTWSWDSQVIEAGADSVAVVTAGREPQVSLPVDITPAGFLYGIGLLLGAR